MSNYISEDWHLLRKRRGGLEVVDEGRAVLRDRVVALFFGARWCPPSLAFLPKLNAWYEGLSEKLRNHFALIYVSFDADADTFGEHFERDHGDWYALAHDIDRASGLCDSLQCDGLPTLAVIDDDGRLITSDGIAQVERGGIARKGAESMVEWYTIYLRTQSKVERKFRADCDEIEAETARRKAAAQKRKGP